MAASCLCAAAGTAWVRRRAAALPALLFLLCMPWSRRAAALLSLLCMPSRCCRAGGPWLKYSPVPRTHLPAANALDKIVMELTLLGFVSLILTAFASPLSHICGEHPWARAAFTYRQGKQQPGLPGPGSAPQLWHRARQGPAGSGTCTAAAALPALGGACRTDASCYACLPPRRCQCPITSRWMGGRWPPKSTAAPAAWPALAA